MGTRVVKPAPGGSDAWGGRPVIGTGIVFKQTDGSGREVDRFSTLLGRTVRIMCPAGVPKAREDCQPFTFSIVTTPPLPRRWHGGASQGGQGWGYSETETDTHRAKTVVAISKFGPACNRCRRSGKNCAESKSKAVHHACLISRCNAAWNR